MVFMLNMDTAMYFSTLTELQMYTLLVMLMLRLTTMTMIIIMKTREDEHDECD